MPLFKATHWSSHQTIDGFTSSPDAFAHPPGTRTVGPDAGWRFMQFGMMVGGLSSLMLQALHPRALAAVWDHSNFRHNLKGRLGRTAYFVAVTTYGATADALAAIERVNKIHAQVKGLMPDGNPYVANEPELLRWVHLGEVTSFLNGYQWLSNQPLNGAEANTYILEMASIGQRLGADPLPTDATSSHEALKQFLPQLKFDARTQEILHVIESYPVDLWDMPFMKLVIQASFHILPDWALAMLGKPLASDWEKHLVRQALRIVPVEFVDDVLREALLLERPEDLFKKVAVVEEKPAQAPVS